MKITREEAEGHLQAGRPVAFRPEAEGAPARTLQVPEGGKRAVKARLPSEEEEGEYLLLRDEKGNLTRAGMEHVMATGGTVMLDGKVIEYRDDLPTEAELARGDERREAAVRDACDARIAELMAERAKLDRPEGEPRGEAITKPQPGLTTPAPTPPPAPRPRPAAPRPQPPTGRERAAEKEGD